MRIFNVQKTNEYGFTNTMLILSEDDVEKQSNKFKGFGYEILVLPSKYKEISNDYLNNIRELATIRKGEVIYV